MNVTRLENLRDDSRGGMSKARVPNRDVRGAGKEDLRRGGGMWKRLGSKGDSIKTSIK